MKCNKLQDGGHQEKDLRAGTENVPGIVGLGKAIEISNNNLIQYNNKLKKLRDYFIFEIEKNIPYIKINGHKIKRSSGNANISFKFVEGENLLLKLDSKGICVSTGSACSSGLSTPSHVLLAIGLANEFINGTLRVTFGVENTKEDVDYLIENLIKSIQEIRNQNPEYIKFIKNNKKTKN